MLTAQMARGGGDGLMVYFQAGRLNSLCSGSSSADRFKSFLSVFRLRQEMISAPKSRHWDDEETRPFQSPSSINHHALWWWQGIHPRHPCFVSDVAYWPVSLFTSCTLISAIFRNQWHLHCCFFHFFLILFPLLNFLLLHNSNRIIRIVICFCDH